MKVSTGCEIKTKTITNVKLIMLLNKISGIGYEIKMQWLRSNNEKNKRFSFVDFTHE